MTKVLLWRKTFKLKKLSFTFTGKIQLFMGDSAEYRSRFCSRSNVILNKKKKPITIIFYFQIIIKIRRTATGIYEVVSKLCRIANTTRDTFTSIRARAPTVLRFAYKR